MTPRALRNRLWRFPALRKSVDFPGLSPWNCLRSMAIPRETKVPEIHLEFHGAKTSGRFPKEEIPLDSASGFKIHS